ncbi:hypothetical protein [Deinococcus ruber]|uniref:Carboxypeptidase regulatory-like domain-containing protein n=1 Tax=Deinococcus ruber TaxID=1848197 RepID=A0A918CHW6_9DEIO|nr:hypothetical protein [Deinococcus ruber]GGR23780.1 hypothetical protein GCM10008957_39570 [Deinococcus ruber]
MQTTQARYALAFMLLCSVAAASPPLALSTSNGVTTLSGKVTGWTLGARTLAFSEPGQELARGKMNADGTFQIALPTAAQLKHLTTNVGEMYDVVGCDNQSSDYDISNREADLYWLPLISVLKTRPDPRAPFERAQLYNLATGGKDQLRLVYATDDTTVRVAISCPAFGSDKSVVYDLHVAPGWNMVLDRLGSETNIRNAPSSLDTRWLYGVR